MKITSIQFEDTMYETIRAEAYKRHASIGKVVREAVEASLYCTCCHKRPKKDGNKYLCRACERKNGDQDSGHSRKNIHGTTGKS